MATNLPDCVVNTSKSSSNSVVAIIADSVVADSNACLSGLPQSAGNVGLVVSIFGVDTVVEPKTAFCHEPVDIAFCDSSDSSVTLYDLS